MRAAKIIFWIWLFCAIGMWIRDGQKFGITETLPFSVRPQRFSPDYELLALGAIGIGIWGFCMLQQTPPNQQQPTGSPPKPPGSQFRAELILVPLTIIGLALFGRHWRSSLHFTDLVKGAGDTEELRHLALLCLAVFGVLLLIKALRGR